MGITSWKTGIEIHDSAAFTATIDANVGTRYYGLYENSWPMIFWVSICRILHWWDYCFVQKLLEFNDTMQKLFLLIEVSRICTQLSHEQFRDTSSTHPWTVYGWHRGWVQCVSVSFVKLNIILNALVWIVYSYCAVNWLWCYIIFAIWLSCDVSKSTTSISEPVSYLWSTRINSKVWF